MIMNSRPGVPPAGLSSYSSLLMSPSSVIIESSLAALQRLIVSEDAEECGGRIVGSSSVEQSKSVSVPASLATSDLDAIDCDLREWDEEYKEASSELSREEERKTGGA